MLSHTSRQQQSSPEPLCVPRGGNGTRSAKAPIRLRPARCVVTVRIAEIDAVYLEDVVEQKHCIPTAVSRPGQKPASCRICCYCCCCCDALRGVLQAISLFTRCSSSAKQTCFFFDSYSNVAPTARAVLLSLQGLSPHCAHGDDLRPTIPLFHNSRPKLYNSRDGCVSLSVTRSALMFE